MADLQQSGFGEGGGRPVATRAGAAGLVALLALVGFPRIASAQTTAAPSAEARAAAAAAYQQGVRAFEAGDFGAAAEFFETADRTAPAAQAAIFAIRAHRGAGDLVHTARAATIALRLLSRYPTETRVTGYAYRVIDEVGAMLGRLQVRCQGCDLAVDMQASEHELFVAPGRHTLAAAWGTRTAQRELDVPANQTTNVELSPPLTTLNPAEPAPVRPPNPALVPASNVTVRPTAPPVTTPDTAPRATGPDGYDPSDWPPPRRSGLSPGVFVTGVVITLGLGGALTWSALNTLEGRDAYVQNPTQEGLDDGRARELRTNILIGATAGMGAITLLVGAAFTRWGSDRPRTLSVSPALLGPSARQAGSAPGLLLQGVF